MKINFRLIIAFSILMSFLSSGDCMAKSAIVFGNMEFVKTYPTDSADLFFSPFIDSIQNEFNINTSSDDDFSGLDFHQTALVFYTSSYKLNPQFSPTYFIKETSFLTCNMAPVRNRLLYLLFHTLQIPF